MPNFPDSDELPLCCNRQPTLRVQPRVLFKTMAVYGRYESRTITYVRYECRTCGAVGGLATTLEGAARVWRRSVTIVRNRSGTSAAAEPDQ
ncbi:MAG: hypothetical protein QOE70_3613 [Chthoniobacter sp.]|jgi:hypothetical protein|nr:hypothetical protein [Chthoniobacter sp.]